MTIFCSTNTLFNSIWFQNASSRASVLILDLHYIYWKWNLFIMNIEYMNACLLCIFGKKSNCTEVNRFECTYSKMNLRLQIRSCPLFTGWDSWKILPCIISMWLSVNLYMGILSIWNQYLALFSHAKVGIPSKWMC